MTKAPAQRWLGLSPVYWIARPALVFMLFVAVVVLSAIDGEFSPLIWFVALLLLAVLAPRGYLFGRLRRELRLPGSAANDWGVYADDALTITAAITPEFRRTFTELRQVLGIEGDIAGRDGTKFTVDVDDRGISLNAAEAPEPVAFVPWPDVGRIREQEQLQQAPTRRQLGELLLAVVTLGVRPTSNRAGFPILCVPVLVPDHRVEVRISVDTAFGVAREFERRRPRPAYGTAAPWAES